jgi:glycosyltransferase involved in cell wall biosynthesis
MKVALVHDWLTGMRGGEKCLEVFCEIFPEADLFTLVYDPESVSPIIKQLNITASWIDRLPLAKKHFRYLLPLFPRAIESFDFAAYDLVLSSSHCVAKGIFPHRALHVAYVHAPMRYVWDQHDAYFGAEAPWPARAAMALCRGYLQRWDRRSTGRVDEFVANSRNVAAKIQALYGREAAVIYPPVDVDRFRLAELQEAFYLIVSALVPYKKIDIAIEAFNRLKLPLKIAGAGPMRRRLEKLAHSNIEFLGWVNDETLASLYASCQALVFPGEEDFGIVPLEAQASGRPVIAYAKGGALETILPLDGDEPGSPTGVFFHELTPESLIAAVRVFEQYRDRFDPGAIRGHSCRYAQDRFKVEIRNYLAARVREHEYGELPNVKTP